MADRDQPQWRGWQQDDASTPAVTSARLAAGAPVKNRMFPKVRSWFALGAPLELLSPRSVARVVFVLSVLLVPLAALAAPAGRMPVIAVATAGGLAALVVMLGAPELPPLTCHLVSAAATSLAVAATWALAPTHAGAAPAALVALPAVFAGLFLPARAILVHQLATGTAIAVALAGAWGVGPAIAFGLFVALGTSGAALTVWLTTSAARRGGTVDPDTGVPNGYGLAARLRRPSADDRLVVAAVALRGLADAREALGYHVGTELLRRAVEDLGQVLPAAAAIARVEGDELIVAAPIGATADADEAGAALAEHIVEGIGAGRYDVDRIEVSLRAHVGLAVAPHDGDDVTELVRRASLAARAAASSGRPVARWDGGAGALTADDLTLLTELRTATERGELWMAYQPQIDPGTGRTVAVEALIRWSHPRLGLVPPMRFISLAERTGLVDRLTTWVFDTVLDAEARWHASGLWLPASVNVSPLSLADPELSDRILDALRARRLPHELLTVEVTETAAVDVVHAVDRLRPLHDSGVSVSIDDFGTGYTSLSVLPHLPVDELKVDQRFVRASLTSKADDVIVHSVRELAHRLGLEAVAEGVEDAALAERMGQAGFDRLQGYFYARPLTESDLLSFVAVPAPAPASVPASPSAP